MLGCRSTQKIYLVEAQMLLMSHLKLSHSMKQTLIEKKRKEKTLLWINNTSETLL